MAWRLRVCVRTASHRGPAFLRIQSSSACFFCGRDGCRIARMAYEPPGLSWCVCGRVGRTSASRHRRAGGAAERQEHHPARVQLATFNIYGWRHSR